MKHRIDVYFTDENEKKMFQELSKKHGFKSFGAFVKASLLFYDKFYEHYCKMIDIYSKLDMKLDDLHNKTVESSTKIESDLGSIREHLLNYVSGSNVMELKDKFLDVLAEKYPQWVSLSDIITLLSLNEDLNRQREFKVFIEKDIELRYLIEQKIGNNGEIYFRARDEALPMDEKYIIVPE